MASESESVCGGCGRGVDPLRAGHVAIFEGRFHYFCGQDCKEQYQRGLGLLSADDVATAAPPEVHAAFESEVVAPLSRPPAPHPLDVAPPTTAYVPMASDRPSKPSLRASSAARRGERFLAAIDAVGIIFGALVPALELLGSVADFARVPLTIGAWCALGLRASRAGSDPADPHPLVVLVPTAAAVLATGAAAVFHDPHAVGIAIFAGLSCSVAIAVERLVLRGRYRVQIARERIEQALDVTVRVLREGLIIELAASEVRAGEQIVVDAGEVVGVDAIVLAGEARTIPWFDARVEVVRREGDPIVAGARVTSSRLRLTTTWSGRERAWVRLLSDPATRIDVAAPTARVVRHTVERGTPVAAALVGVAAFAANATSIEILASMSAAAIAFAARAVPSFVGLAFARAHLEALASGITYKDPRAFERAGATDVAVLSARGTVLLGEPEIVAVEGIGGPKAAERLDAAMETGETARVLALAAGAETASTHPFAAAILRAARTRGVRADHVRNATVHSGLGVTALASTGERLVVGGRAIMLEEKIGGAVADARVSELEAQGRSVLLVALGDRLVGLIALQDGLRAGARATVQKLLDAGIEPVLLSGEARDTCETIGRALDVDHVRPEVLPADRGAEVRALAEGGGVISVIGHPAIDDGALGAADVAVAMGAAGSTPGEWAIALASDDVRDAAEALAIPHATRRRVWAAIALGVTPGLVAVLAVGFGIAPLAMAPLSMFLGAVAISIQAREGGTRPAPR